MKILAVCSAILPDPNKQSQVDHWRVLRPMQELAKNTDWKIDYSPSFVQGFEGYETKEQFTEEEMEKAFKKICGYDIVFASYHPDPTAYTMLKVARDRAGVQFIMDCDDDMFAINPDNPFWLKMDDEKVYWMQRMIADNDWITTPSPILAKRFRKRRKDKSMESVCVIPNYIADVYKHPKFNNKDVVIGYMGGSSHYADLHDSGALDAVANIMHKYKNIRFKSVGMLVDKYTPKARTEFNGGKRGTAFLKEIYPKLKFDIGIGPILDNIFNQGKSNIKWQEMTRAGAAFVGSNVGPYRDIKDGCAILVENNEEDWYTALEKLVLDVTLRKELVATAREELEKNWRLENRWREYQRFFQRVKDTSRKDNLNKRGFIV